MHFKKQIKCIFKIKAFEMDFEEPLPNVTA